MATTSTSFTFPPLRLKKSDLGSLNFDRLCFQFLVRKDNVCTLLAYKLNATRGCNTRSGIIELEIARTHRKVLKLKPKVLFVQQEITIERLQPALNSGDDYLFFFPEQDAIQNYKYVKYHIRSTASQDVTTSPCPPAKPPEGGGEGAN